MSVDELSGGVSVGIPDKYLNGHSLANITRFLENKIVEYYPRIEVSAISEPLENNIKDYIEYHIDGVTKITENTPIILGTNLFYSKTQEHKTIGIKDIEKLLNAALSDALAIKDIRNLYNSLLNGFIVDGIETEIFSVKLQSESVFDEHLRENFGKVLPVGVAVLKRVNDNGKIAFYEKPKIHTIDLFSSNGSFSVKDESVLLLEELLVYLSNSLHFAEVTAYSFIPYLSMSPVIFTEDVSVAKYAFQLLEGKDSFNKLAENIPFINEKHSIIIESSIPISLNIEVKTPNSNVTNIISLYIGQAFLGMPLIGMQNMPEFYKNLTFGTVHNILDSEDNGVISNAYTAASVYTETDVSESTLTAIEASKKFSFYNNLYGVLTSTPVI